MTKKTTPNPLNKPKWKLYKWSSVINNLLKVQIKLVIKCIGKHMYLCNARTWQIPFIVFEVSSFLEPFTFLWHGIKGTSPMVVTAKFTYTPNLPTYPTVIKKELLDKKVYVKYSEVKYSCSGQLVNQHNEDEFYK